MNNYCLGFCFPNKSSVYLIKKKRPKWQKNKWNGIGGHIEEHENMHQAMSREFEEETGCYLRQWSHCITILMEYGNLFIFKNEQHRSRKTIKSATDEEVKLFYINNLSHFKYMIPNLKWIIPLLVCPHQEFKWPIHIRSGFVPPK